jgi:hypothetical protein
VFFAVPWQLVLFLLGMVVVLKKWDSVAGLLALFVVLSAGLYWFWFRHLAESPATQLSPSLNPSSGSVKSGEALPES